MHIPSTHDLLVHFFGSPESHASVPPRIGLGPPAAAVAQHAARVANRLHAQPVGVAVGTSSRHVTGLIVPARWHAPVDENSSTGCWVHHDGVGLQGGSDRGDDGARHVERQRLQAKQTQLDQKLAELAGVRTTLQASIAHEQRAVDAARQRVEVHRYGLREATRLFDELDSKRRQGEAGLDAVLATQANEMRGWQRDLDGAERESGERSRAALQLADTLRQVESDIDRLRAEHAEVHRSLRRL